MFRRQEDTLAPDPSFAADLKELGFFINKVGHIRMIEAPDKQYIFHSTNNERVNEVRREAMQTCQREESEKRLSALGLTRVYLPEFSATKPVGPHVAILAPQPEILKTRKRVVVIVNDALQDLGILSYRQLQRELGVNGGSIVNFMKEMIKRSAADNTAQDLKDIFDDGYAIKDDNGTPALVVMNTGQLLYSHKYNNGMTMRSWSAMPRKSVAHDMIRIHEEENRVKGHRSPREHVKSVFDEVLCNADRVASDAEVYIIAIEDGIENVLNVLSENFDKYGSRVTAMALIHSSIDDSQIKDPSVRALLHQRTRHWKYSDMTLDPLHCTDLPDDYEDGLKHEPSQEASSTRNSTKRICWSEDLPVPAPMSTLTKALHRLAVSVATPRNEAAALVASDTCTGWSTGQSVICATFAGGNEPSGECVFTNPAVQHAILSFFEEVAQDPENYRNPDIKIYTEAPQPSPEKALALSADDPNIFSYESVLPEMTPEQAELDEERQKLNEMRIALHACPLNVQELEAGRERLVKRIQDKEVEIDALEKKALAGGGLKAGEALDQRENWKPQKEGPKVAFAGTMVDSELLKAAGMFDTANQELDKLGDGDDQKAFF
ncbi:Nn.00g038740.m01.CDS01 [Neocucurbitaria sp. VM-36]